MPFIPADAQGKTEPSKRRLIRRHVMLGRNRGKTRHAKPGTTSSWHSEHSGQGPDGASGLLIKMGHSTNSVIPPRVGSELSFTQFAAAVEPPLIHDVLRCTPTFYPSPPIFFSSLPVFFSALPP